MTFMEWCYRFRAVTGWCPATFKANKNALEAAYNKGIGPEQEAKNYRRGYGDRFPAIAKTVERMLRHVR